MGLIKKLWKEPVLKWVVYIVCSATIMGLTNLKYRHDKKIKLITKSWQQFEEIYGQNLRETYKIPENWNENNWFNVLNKIGEYYQKNCKGTITTIEGEENKSTISQLENIAIKQGREIKKYLADSKNPEIIIITNSYYYQDSEDAEILKNSPGYMILERCDATEQYLRENHKKCTIYESNMDKIKAIYVSSLIANLKYSEKNQKPTCLESVLGYGDYRSEIETKRNEIILNLINEVKGTKTIFVEKSEDIEKYLQENKKAYIKITAQKPEKCQFNPYSYLEYGEK